jgi:hypothetical protein
MLSNPAIMGGTSTTVTITPDSQQIANTYTILAISNVAPDPNQRQIAARILSSQQTQTKNINGTGHNQTAATTAKGTVTFFNGSSNGLSVLAGENGVQGWQPLTEREVSSQNSSFKITRKDREPRQVSFGYRLFPDMGKNSVYLVSPLY